jgi:undecaprenyl pyrophosphate phosphatase UppP
MTSFVHVDYPMQHGGVVRAERAAKTLRQAAQRFDPTRAGASLLLAAIVAAMVVVAGQVVETWTEGHLLAAWTVMWTVVFAALALFASPAKRAVLAIGSLLQRWAAARKRRAEDDQLWQLAMTDARVMADISRAMSAGASREARFYRYY